MDRADHDGGHVHVIVEDDVVPLREIDAVSVIG